MNPDDPAVLATDLAVAVALLGIALRLRGRSRPTAVLVACVAVAWLAGFVSPLALYWHRAVLVHALLAYPGWRPRSFPALVLTGSTYAVCVLAPEVWYDDRATLALALALSLVSAWSLRGVRGPQRSRRRWALGAALVWCTVMVLVAVAGLVWGTTAWFLALVAYDVGVVAACALLYVGAREPRVASLTDLVVDLGVEPTVPIRDALAKALQDPDLVVATWDPSRNRFTTSAGRTVDESSPTGRSHTRLDREGRPFVLLEHDAAISGHSQLRTALDAAARLEVANASWQAEVAVRAAEVEGSRERLLGAADEARRRLESELRSGVEVRLADLAARLDSASHDQVLGDEHLEAARDQLTRTRAELRALASGLRPSALDAGLTAALAELVRTSPVRVSLRTDVGSVSPEVEVATYYVCTEALANVAKHARGAGARIDVTSDGSVLRATVADDGPGGATTSGSGLTGLRDRVEIMGGRLSVSSSPAGTTVAAELPLGRRRG